MCPSMYLEKLIFVSLLMFSTVPQYRGGGSPCDCWGRPFACVGSESGRHLHNPLRLLVADLFHPGLSLPDFKFTDVSNVGGLAGHTDPPVVVDGDLVTELGHVVGEVGVVGPHAPLLGVVGMGLVGEIAADQVGGGVSHVVDDVAGEHGVLLCGQVLSVALRVSSRLARSIRSLVWTSPESAASMRASRAATTPRT